MRSLLAMPNQYRLTSSQRRESDQWRSCLNTHHNSVFLVMVVNLTVIVMSVRIGSFMVP